jgi:predicted site-specific integrase-resolvase
MHHKFPDAEIIKDVGSGINYKRKGLRAILGRVLRGEKLTLVVAHRDRLVRFGFDLIKFLVEENGGEIVVLEDRTHSPEDELVRDLVSIINVFACRLHGLRRYGSQISKDKTLSDS